MKAFGETVESRLYGRRARRGAFRPELREIRNDGWWDQGVIGRGPWFYMYGWCGCVCSEVAV